MRLGAWTCAVALAVLAPASARANDDAQLGLALGAALPDGGADLLLVQEARAAIASRVLGATRVAAPPGTVRAVLLDPAHYRALVPALQATEVGGAAKAQPGAAAPLVAWELEIPLFNLSGRLALRDRPDGVSFELVDGDLAPGRIVFSFGQIAGGGCTLIVDAQLNVKRSSWLLRHLISRSPAGEPAVLAAAAYVALRAVALRAEHPYGDSAWRPTAPPGAARLPDAGPLAAEALAPLRARGRLALVARERTERLGGVALGIDLYAPAARVERALRDPATWRAFPGWKTVRLVAGTNGAGAEVEDDLPLVDLDATWIAEAGLAPRWTVAAGATRGARLGWNVYALTGATPTLATLLLYPRLEATGIIARRFIAAEPLLEEGLALALGIVDASAMEVSLRTLR